MTPEFIGQLVLYVCTPFCLAVLVLMALTYRNDPNVVLRQNLQVMTIITLGVALFGLIFVNNDQPIPPLDVLTTKYITRYYWLAIGIIPALTWLLLRLRK